jgi:hypothetical protein
LIDAAMNFRRETSALENLTSLIRKLNLPAEIATELKSAEEVYSQSKRYKGEVVDREDEVLGEGEAAIAPLQSRRGSAKKGTKRVYVKFDLKDEKDAVKKMKTGLEVLDAILAICGNDSIPESNEQGTSG